MPVSGRSGSGRGVLALGSLSTLAAGAALAAGTVAHDPVMTGLFALLSGLLALMAALLVWLRRTDAPGAGWASRASPHIRRSRTRAVSGDGVRLQPPGRADDA
ncbi:hypothetical protein Dalu01_02458 [Deinococcus aluminii]|uniref:MFS transporter n=1 Tax=Deinococcus aluminii TaxID=1656885 RepID=A0ABP9XFB6_9DEIO